MAFHLFKQKPLDVLTDEEKGLIVAAIRKAESRTSGEIRVYMESRCKYVNPVDRAREVFFSLKMDHTAGRNAVLLYMAVKDRQMAIFGDEGIHAKAGTTYWEETVNHILQHFNKENYVQGITEYITEIGNALHRYFPYDNATDQNELPDEIVFGH